MFMQCVLYAQAVNICLWDWKYGIMIVIILKSAHDRKKFGDPFSSDLKRTDVGHTLETLDHKLLNFKLTIGKQYCYKPNILECK